MFGVIEYLERHGASLADVVASVRPLGPDEILLLVGSVAEGIANPGSDLDLLLLESDADRVPARSDTSIPAPAGFDLNLEIVPLADAALLCQHVVDDRDLHRAPADGKPKRSRRIVGSDDLRLLHRLRTGVPLAPGPANITRFRERFQLHALPEFCLVQHLNCHLGLRADALQALDQANDPESALLMCQLAARRLLSALLAWTGETNPGAKWTLRLLKDHSRSLSAFQADRLTDFLFPSRSAPAETVHLMYAASVRTIELLVNRIRPRDAELADAIAVIAATTEGLVADA